MSCADASAFGNCAPMLEAVSGGDDKKKAKVEIAEIKHLIQFFCQTLLTHVLLDFQNRIDYSVLNLALHRFLINCLKPENHQVICLHASLLFPSLQS